MQALETGVEFEDQQATASRGRFVYFQRLVSRCRIWQDHNKQLWKKLKRIASGFMDEMAILCDARFELLCGEPGADELLLFKGSHTQINYNTECNTWHQELARRAEIQNTQR